MRLEIAQCEKIQIVMNHKIWFISLSHESWTNNKCVEFKSSINSTLSNIAQRKKKLNQICYSNESKTCHKTQTIIILIEKWFC